MKHLFRTRHLVTLGVLLAVAALAAGAAWRLRDAGAAADSADTLSATADSVRRELASTAASEALGAEIAVPVDGARVRRDTFVIWVTAEGEAAAVRRTTFHAEVAGPVTEVPAAAGDRVEEGDLLVRIDPVEFELTVREAEATLEQARAEFRSMMLLGDGMVADSLVEARRQVARVRSGLASAEIQLEKARLELEKTAVRAPFDGWVANLAVSPGSRVRTGDSLVSVLDLSRVDVAVEVLETQLPAVAVGRRVTARFPAFPSSTFTGRVVRVNPEVDPSTDTGRVTVGLSNPDARIVPGMHAQVRIAGRLHADRVFVPREAVVERSGRRDVVFVFEPESPGSAVGRAQWKYVNPGLENDDFVEIAAPESDAQVDPSEVAGRIVLVDGHVTLTHDARVRLENAEGLEGSGAEGPAGGSGGTPDGEEERP